MKNLTRDHWLALGLFAALLLTTAAAALQQNRDIASPPLASDSTAPEGARALSEWLAALGYRVDNDPQLVFAIPAEATLALMLEPSEAVSDDEWRLLDAWVEQGGTLLIAGSNWWAQDAGRHYDIDSSYRGEISATVEAASPLMAAPPPPGLEAAAPRRVLIPYREDALPLLVADGEPVFVTFALGEGRVLLGATAEPLTNAGLKAPGAAELVLNWLAPAGAPGTVWFDEWHHGQRASDVEILGPESWLRNTPGGRSLLFTGVVVFVALVLRGRAFGRPLPLTRPAQRRSPLEHVTALANLSRRAGRRAHALQHYHLALKRSLGRRYRLDPVLPDDEFIAALAHINPQLDTPALTGLLRRLQQENISETELVRLAEEASDRMKETP